MFHGESRTHSAPSRGIVPQGKGREGIRKGKEERADPIHPQVEGAIRGSAATQTALPCPAMNGITSW